jgi:HK97 family phage major capsid protein
MSKLKELREQRAKAHADAVAILKKETITADDRTAFDKAMAEVDVMGADIERIVRSEKVAAEIAAVPLAGAEVRTTANTKEAREIRHKEVIADYLRGGLVGMSAENRSVLMSEYRDQAAGTQTVTASAGAAGGYFVPAGFVYEVEQATKYFCPLIDGGVVRVIETASGQVLPFPTGNDTANQAAVLAENVADTELDVAIGSISFHAYKYRTGLVRVSLELMQDSAFNIESYLAQRFAERLGRGYEAAFTNGSGVNQPTGFLTAIAASGASPVIAKGSAVNDGSANTGANSIGYADLVNLEHSIDPSYRRGAKYMFHDQTLSFLKTLLDKFGRPLWTPGIKDNEPDTLNGYQYVINQSMPQIGASNVTVAFGDWSKFVIRKVKDLQVLRLDERYAEFGQVAYIGFSRVDSNLVDAGMHPLNTLQQHS